MTVPTYEFGSLAALRVEVPDFPCNPPGYPRQWMQDTLVSAFHPEEASPVPSTKGASLAVPAWPLLEARRERTRPAGHDERSSGH